MTELKSPIWKCKNGHAFDTPSYSAGWTEYINDYMTRHHGDRHICPECFTPDINPVGQKPEGFFKKRCVIKPEYQND